jgi:uncharacterized protein (TIGR00730 family)
MGRNPIYQDTAFEVGKYLAINGLRLVYGGGNVGLMGTAANACLQHGGEVIGIIPHFLAREVPNLQTTELVFVDTMLERKQIMAQRSDAVITLPGAYGTMDELFEELTAKQLGIHKRPVGLLNVNGFYDPLIQMLDNMTEEGFLKPENRRLLLLANTVEDLMQQFNEQIITVL